MPHRSASHTVVLLALHWGRTGGLESVSREVAWAFAALGWRVHVIAVFDEGTPILSPGLDVSRLAPRSRILRSIWYRGLWKPMAAWHLRRALERGGLVICGHAHLLPALALLPNGAVHRWGWVYGLEVWGAQASRWRPFLSRLDRVVSISQFTAGEVSRAGVTSPVSVVPCSVDASVFTPTPTPERIRRDQVLICGRMSSTERYKGHEVLFESLAVAEYLLGRPVHLRVVGGGDDEARLRGIVRTRGLEERVTFSGQIPLGQLVDAYRHCGVFCMPSPVERRARGYWSGEGFGIVYIEAAACGRPVIASSEGGAPETLAPGKSGLLADPRSPDAVGTAIAKVLQDPHRADEMGREGRLLVERRFSRERFLLHLKELVAVEGLGGPGR